MGVFKRIKQDQIFYILLTLYIVSLLFLSFFRDMVSDEALYFHETFLISELFKTGTWVGAYGVGLHGFLFQIPPALIFLITGPSVAIVTIYNILLTAIVAILSFKLSSFVLKNKTYGILATTILLFNFHFFISAGTFLREIPALVVILLLLNHVVRKYSSGKIILGLLFLLLLDAKEYIFVIFSLAFIIWLFVDSTERNFLKRIWHVFKQSFLIFLPSLIWIILMFTTHIVPVNMFLASTIGLRDNVFGYLINHFDIETATLNTLEGGKDMFLILIQDTWHPIVIFLARTINTLLSYIGKVMYPRVFSFISVPKVVMLPVVASALLTLKRFVFNKNRVSRETRKKIRKYAFLSILLLTWLVIYILRASHGRYLLPIVPAIAIIYIYFLFKQKLSLKQRRIIFWSTFLYVSAGVYFETSYVLPKVLLEYSILTLFFTSIYKPNLKSLKYLMITILAIGSLSSAILFSYVQGQIYGYRNFGVNRNAYEISKLLPSEQRYWINTPSNQHLISSYNSETYLSPTWKWRLHEIVPIRESLKTYGEQQAFYFQIGDTGIFRGNLELYDIEYVFFVSTDIDDEIFPDQEFLDDLLLVTWLQLTEKVEYKGMEIYIFEIIK